MRPSAPVPSARDPRARRRALAALVVAAVVAGTAPALTATAHAVDLPPWTPGTSVTAEQLRDADTQALVRTGDGTTVVLYGRHLYDAENNTALYAAVRPAGSETWGTPKQLSVAARHPGAGRLAVVGDRVVAVWADYPHSRGSAWDRTPGRIVTATLDGGTWSAPTTLLDVDRNGFPDEPDLAAGTDGTLALTWQQRQADGVDWSVWAATRSPAGTWSAPAQVSRATEDGAHEAAHPEAAVAAGGRPVVAFRQLSDDQGASIRTSTLPAGASAWTRPAVVASAPALGEPALAGSGTGTVGLTWSQWRRAEGDRILRTATAATADAAWSEAAPLAVGPHLGKTPEPLIGPAGDVTLVWNGGTDEFRGRIRSATLGHADRRWSAVTAVSTKDHFVIATDHDASLGADGTVRVVWAQDGREMRQARLKDGVWTGGSLLWGSRADHVRGLVVAGPDGTATAVWGMRGKGGTGLMSARTTTAPLTVDSTGVPARFDVRQRADWPARWQLSRPVSSWTLTLTDTSGRFRSTVTGGEALTPSTDWNGRADGSVGTLAPNGPLKWALKGTPVGEETERTLATGTVTVVNGGGVFRDQGSATGLPDGTGDALVLTSGGGLRSVYGDRATGAFKGTATGEGWAAGSLPVPVGDLDGDRCNDLLVRNSKGELRRYTPACGTTVTPKTANKLLGPGWNQYDVLTSPGDVTGDGRADLIARSAATGALYRYSGTEAGLLASRVKLTGSYKGYKRITGAGDLNGDGHGDLLLQSRTAQLYRMNGTGRGTFAAPVKLADGWGASYDAVVAAGDLTGDGRADLLARDTSGTVWRYAGTGKGTFGGRVKIATGWQVYKGLY
ncbi:FG-GAP repeat domain-containing protein [Streptomyces sp. NPDC093225]|uniref:FG-GAP repeat domain-containing protein n=1 Tax=Streptomyces sp. NPDC093225 TaxID=3366034 RepID=UPI003806BAA2